MRKDKISMGRVLYEYGDKAGRLAWEEYYISIVASLADYRASMKQNIYNLSK